MILMGIGVLITFCLCGFCLICLVASSSGYEKTRIVSVRYVNCTEEEWLSRNNQVYKNVG